MTTYTERDVLGGWSIEVSLNGFVIGRIRKIGADGGFGYYKGPNNLLNWSILDDDLEALKEKIDSMVRSQQV